MGNASTAEKGAKSSMFEGDDDEIINNSTNSKQPNVATTSVPTTTSSSITSKNKINESIQIASIEKENEEEYDYLVKVVLVGDYGVGRFIYHDEILNNIISSWSKFNGPGKTSLAKKISQRGFTTQHQPTIGIDFVVCTLVLNTKETGM